MITNDKGIVELKHHVLREVCRLAWEDRLTADETEKIVYDISPSRATAAVSIRNAKSSGDGSDWRWGRIRSPEGRERTWWP